MFEYLTISKLLVIIVIAVISSAIFNIIVFGLFKKIILNKIDKVIEKQFKKNFNL